LSLPLTPEILEAAYEFLRTWPAFSRCGLPNSSEVEFHVTQSTRAYGHYSQRTSHAIYVSHATNGLSDTMLRTMAHEMVHQALRLKGDPKFWQHGAAFKAIASRVCKHSGWDVKAF
jgi:hypothetical protein